MKKRLIIIFINIFILFAILFLTDIFIYKSYTQNIYKLSNTNYTIPKFKYFLKNDLYNVLDKTDFFNGEDNVYYGRLPDGLEYKNSSPIVLFGCSVAYGQYLNSNQTLSYKLSHSLKRTVYNRGIAGGGIQHMYLQSKTNSFYKTIPTSTDVIYIFIAEHYRRSLVWTYDVLSEFSYPHCALRNNELKIDNPNNIFNNIFKSSYLVKWINQAYVKNYIYNQKNADKLTDLMLLYFISTRKELEQHWNKKVNFTVVFYEDWGILYKDKLIKKLKNNGFKVISSSDIIKEELRAQKYTMMDNAHPKEIVWDILTPEIVKEITK